MSALDSEEALFGTITGLPLPIGTQTQILSESLSQWDSWMVFTSRFSGLKWIMNEILDFSTNEIYW
jgi:hypothetical protein